MLSEVQAAIEAVEKAGKGQVLVKIDGKIVFIQQTIERVLKK